MINLHISMGPSRDQTHDPRPWYSYSTQVSMKFILLIKVKMPTICGILTFISMINTTSERPKHKTLLYFSFNEQLKFRAQLSWAWITFYNLGAWLCNQTRYWLHYRVWLSYTCTLSFFITRNIVIFKKGHFTKSGNHTVTEYEMSGEPYRKCKSPPGKVLLVQL